jgi:D-allulose-6-phosphate 3-epimerase
MKEKFAVSLMCMDFLKMKEQLEILNQRVGMYHIDIMDGHYCKNITLSPDLIRAFKKVSTLPMDIHLMTTNHDDWIDIVAEAGADIISPHAETINGDAFRTYNRITNLGCKCGLVLNPATTLESVKHYLNRIDLLTIMTVDVGFSGQPFIEEMLDKIKEAKELREKYGYHYKIQIDGSCNKKTYKALHDAGADIYILGGSGLFSLDEDLNRACDKMYAAYEKEVGGEEE